MTIQKMGITALLGTSALLLVYEAINIAVYHELTPPLLEPMTPISAIGTLSAKACASCHVEIAAEWRSSGHATSTGEALYLADLAQQETTYFCKHCHAPLIEQHEYTSSGLSSVWPEIQARESPNPRYIQGLHHEGVTCVACHQRDGAMVGSFESAIAPHPVRVDPAISTESTCRPCHAMDLRMLGELERPIMDTFAEWEAYKEAGGDKNCVDCHMPSLGERPAARGGGLRPGHSHSLRGPYDIEFVREGAQPTNLSITGSHAAGLKAQLTLKNGTGHHLPSAEPHRKLIAKLEALDSAGLSLVDDEVVIQRKVDLHQLREVPGSDTSLRPREERTLDLRIKGALPARAARARLSLTWVLWDPSDPVAIAAGLGEEELVMTLEERSMELNTSGAEP